MLQQPAPATLESVNGEPVALERVEIEARLRGPLVEATVEQSYHNVETSNIEAVYTFPLPLDAVLLDLSMELNGERMHGVVRAASVAEREYDEAIDEGHSAVLLEKTDSGLYTVNIGNLLAGERAVIRFRYAQLLSWQGDTLRFHLPTTIAPRYGDPSSASLAPHQVPEYVLTADHGFQLVVRIEGALAHASFECPSHPVTVSEHQECREVRVAGGASMMDRDFVLALRAPDSAQAGALVERCEDGHVVVASFHPRVETEAPRAGTCIKLVVDCSGSMAGDSIAQARAALREILARLEPSDWFQLVTFGSSHQALFAENVPATRDNVALAQARLAELDADMGGTEIERALGAAYAFGAPPDVTPDVLLITDGEVWAHESAVEQAARSGHRVFTAGVGSAVSEALLVELARRTGGACELVSPREEMSERIVRHFQRMHQPRADSVTVEWPAEPRWQAPATLRSVFSGDTVHVFGCFAGEPPEGEVALSLGFPGDAVRQTLTLAPPANQPEQSAGTLIRVAVSERLRDLAPDEAATLAERHQLVTEHTSCVLVHERAAGERADDLPRLRTVPQVLAAGWGAVGSIDSVFRQVCAMPMDADADPGLRDHVEFGDGYLVDREALGDDSAYGPDIPSADDSPLTGPVEAAQSFVHGRGVATFVAQLNSRYHGKAPEDGIGIDSLTALAWTGLSSGVIWWLRSLVDESTPERKVVEAFLVVLAESPAGHGLSRQLRRTIRRAARDPETAALAARISQSLLLDESSMQYRVEGGP